MMQGEDLEFSVGSKAAVWQVKDPLLAPGGDYDEDYSDRYTCATMSGAPAVPLMLPLMGAGYSTFKFDGIQVFSSKRRIWTGKGLRGV
jgi:hypothetical protein